MRTPRLSSTAAACLGALLPAACSDPPEPSVGTTAQEISGREGKIDFDIDAPWRIEPVVLSGGVRDYGKIPIQITIDDAHLIGFDDDYEELDRFLYVRVTERAFAGAPLSIYEVEDLNEIEVERGPWVFNGNDDTAERLRPWHDVCEPWREPTCAGLANVGVSAKWYAQLGHQLVGTYLPGDDVLLDVTAVFSATLAGGAEGELMIKGHLSVHLGEEPLPRFGGNWMYGDLHYHSQFTDNEGESGHNVRGVVRAMGAMGMDFAFATDHASYSQQVVDVDILQAGSLLSLAFGDLRDLSPERYRYALERIHDEETGANHLDDPTGQVPQTYRTRQVRPKIFLGSEIDAIPEMTEAQANGGLPFGNGRVHHVDWLCRTAEAALPDLIHYFIGNITCADSNFEQPSSPGRVYSKDLQGGSFALSREHVLHLPSEPGDDHFVPSRTTTWGGASRTLSSVLSNSGASGVTFLAHPVTNDPIDMPGPRLVPYSELQLLEAFGQPTMLGLQLWNENPRLATPTPGSTPGVFGPLESDLDIGPLEDHSAGDCDPYSCILEQMPVTSLSDWTWAHSLTETYGDTSDDFSRGGEDHDIFSSLFHGTTTWDRMNAWGLMPDRTSGLSWLLPGEPRRVFMAGGSDAHGDFNYRRAGYLFGTEESNTTALGSPRNLVDLGYLGPIISNGFSLPMPGGVTFDQGDVVAGLSAGRFSVTDGPALRIVVDRNGNGAIDADDVPMGGIVNLYGVDRIPLLVEWKSTPEFGPIDEINLYVGAVKGSGYAVFAPTRHGVRGPDDRDDGLLPVGTPTHYKPPFPANGKTYYTMNDHYLIDPTSYGATQTTGTTEGQLRLRLLPENRLRYQGDGYSGVYQVELDPIDYLTAATAFSDGPNYFVRAFGITKPERWSECETSAARERLHAQGQCLQRLAYTNPIWALRKPWEWGDICPIDRTRGIDADADGQPDGCDYCPDDPRACGPDTAARTWLARAGGPLGEGVEAVTHAGDAAGNTIVTGRFQSTATFIDNAIQRTAALPSGTTDGYVARVNAEGALTALSQLTGSGSVRIRGVVADPDGSITVAGSFEGQLILATNPVLVPQYTFYAAGTDMFVASFGQASGNGIMEVRWARQFTNTGTATLNAIALGPDGQHYVAGNFDGTLHLNFVTGADTWGPKTSGGGHDCFVARLDSQGRVTRARQIRGTGHCYADAITIESDHELLVGGRFSGEIAYQPTIAAPWSRTAATDYKGFVAKMTNISTMPVAWSVELGAGTGCSNGDAHVRGLASDGWGAVAVGKFRRCVTVQTKNGQSLLAARTHANWEGLVIDVGDGGLIGPQFVTEGMSGNIDLRAVDVAGDTVAVTGTCTAFAFPFAGTYHGCSTYQSGLLATFDADLAPVAIYGVGGSALTELNSISIHRDQIQDPSIPDTVYLLYGGHFSGWTWRGTGDRPTSAGDFDGLFGQWPL